jgi:hypothetical protein
MRYNLQEVGLVSRHQQGWQIREKALFQRPQLFVSLYVNERYLHI